MIGSVRLPSSITPRSSATRRDRAAFLREACAGDDALRRDVESLLGYEDAAAPFLERPAIEHVAPLAESRPESTGDLAGRRLGVYQIEARIGAGGMGEVYRARDTKLGRDVAIKVLPPHLMVDADRRARFEREARLLATLNHSNIAQIYGLEESDGLQALVMELVPGETLDRMIRSPSARIEGRRPHWPSRGRSPTRWMRRTSGESSTAT